VGGERETSLVLTALIALGAAGLSLGALWGWQTWSQRSDPPIDDLLPRLVDTAEPLGSEIEDSDLTVPLVVADPVSPTNEPIVAPEPQVVVVHVSGAVRSPGVVDLEMGSRVFEAMELAGGPTADADLERINLAAAVVDGERIYVPAVGEESAPELVGSDRPSAIPRPEGRADTTDGQPLDLNAATAAELEALSGVGPATAQAIVALREERGPFFTVDELLDVPGIGDAKLALLRPFVTVAAGG